MKQMREPKEYLGDRSHYRQWRERLHAYLNAHGPLYVKVLFLLEDLGRRPFRPEDLLVLASDFQLTAEDLIEAKTALYTLLCSYTGAVNASIRLRRPKGILDAYRKLLVEGLKLTPKHAFLERSALWKVKESSLEKLVGHLERWGRNGRLR